MLPLLSDQKEKRISKMKIEDLFDFETGALPALELLDDGNTPLVYGTTVNNGIVKHVSVENEENIFQPPLITVSYLGTSFVQTVPFTTSVVDKSNIIILRPKAKMSINELYFYCFQINKHGEFGFHYGRRMNMARLYKLDILPFENKYSFDIKISRYLPQLPELSEYKFSFEESLIPVDQIFDITNAKSKGYSSYDSGEIPFISNGLLNNGIVGYITPDEGDRLFTKKSICLSAFCEATIQKPPFIARGNGGSGLTVLTPLKDMNEEVLLFYSAYFNIYCKWRFSFGRMVTKDRVLKLRLPLIK